MTIKEFIFSHEDHAAFIEATRALIAAAKASEEAMDDAIYDGAHLGLSLAADNLSDDLAAHPLKAYAEAYADAVGAFTTFSGSISRLETLTLFRFLRCLKVGA